jgi:hypothetical protein
MTLVEVLAVTVMIVLLGYIFIPHSFGHRNAKLKAQRAACVSNLKQIGLAMRIYIQDHEDRFPWQVARDEGGSLSFASSPNVFEHFRAMSNELVTPKVLACSSDRDRIRTSDFAQISNTNLSYFLCLDAISNAPGMLFSGDRNVCGGSLSNGFMRVIGKGSSLVWTNGLHEMAGNAGLVDGSAQALTSAGLTNLVANSFGTNTVLRLAIP